MSRKRWMNAVINEAKENSEVTAELLPFARHARRNARRAVQELRLRNVELRSAC